MPDAGQPPSKRAVSAEEAAYMMGITLKQFRSLVRSGRFPLPMNHGDGEGFDIRVARWPLADVDAYVHLASRHYRRRRNAQAEPKKTKTSESDKSPKPGHKSP